MSKTLALELPDEIYAAIQQMAIQSGKPVEAIALQWLVQHAPKPRPRLSEEERQAAWQRLLRHAGAADSGDPHSADNEGIDADLAREYGSTHEETG